MRRFVLAYRSAFTLMEVMVAVMIVSVVIAALLRLQGNTSTLYTTIKESHKHNTLVTLLIDNSDYGMTKESIPLYRLLEDFALDERLRRIVKSQKIELSYTKEKQLDLEDRTLELGTTRLQEGNFSCSIKRVLLQ